MRKALYFAYGSNLDYQQMKSRCPSAQFRCVAELRGYRLMFTRCSPKRCSGVADAVKAEGKRVWGVVYEMEENDLARLDKFEGYDPKQSPHENAYNRRQCTVYGTGGDELKVYVYFATPQGRFLPSREYKDLIVSGARHWRLPEEYIRELEGIEVKDQS